MHHFFACIGRMRFIRRWSLMRNTQPENDAEHSLQVAMFAHALAVIGNTRYGKTIDPQHAVTMAVYHDATEVLTGDLPTPVKYHSPDLRKAYHEIENLAEAHLLEMLPEELKPGFAPYICQEKDDTAVIVKAADRLSAYVKCLQEQQAGNHEFDAAADKVLESIHAMQLPQAEDFLREFVPSFTMNIDELNGRGL